MENRLKFFQECVVRVRRTFCTRTFTCSSHFLVRLDFPSGVKMKVPEVFAAGEALKFI